MIKIHSIRPEVTPFHPDTIIQSQGAKVLICGGKTGHAWEAIAFCSTDEHAARIADALEKTR